MSKDYTGTQDEWPDDDRIDDVEIRGSGWGGGSARPYRDGRKIIEPAYRDQFGPRWFSHGALYRGERERRGEWHFSPKWSWWVRVSCPWGVTAFCTLYEDGTVVWEGWLSNFEIIDRWRRVFEDWTRAISPPFNPIETFDPTEIPMPQPRRKSA